MKPHPSIRYIIYAFLICVLIIDCSCHKKRISSNLTQDSALLKDILGRLSIASEMTFAIGDSNFIAVELRRNESGDTLIVRDSLRAIKSLLEQLNRCNKERMKEQEASYFKKYYYKQTNESR